MKTNEQKLRTVLNANATFSLLSGLTLLLFTNTITQLFTIEEPLVFHVIGGGLLFFALTVYYQANRNTINPKQVMLIIYQDWAWVAGSAILLIGGFFAISTIGQLLIAGVAVLVGSFAILQERYLS